MCKIMGQTFPFLFFFFLMRNNMGHCQGQSSLEYLAFSLLPDINFGEHIFEFLSVLIRGRRQWQQTERISVLVKGIRLLFLLGIFFFHLCRCKGGDGNLWLSPYDKGWRMTLYKELKIQTGDHPQSHPG